MDKEKVKRGQKVFLKRNDKRGKSWGRDKGDCNQNTLCTLSNSQIINKI